MEDRLGKKISEEFGKVNTKIKDLREKLTILGKRVKDLERERTRRGDTEIECDVFERVEVVGEKSVDKDEETRDKKKEESGENEEESDKDENQGKEQNETEQKEQTHLEEVDEVEKEQEEKELEHVATKRKNSLINMVVFDGDVFVQQEPRVILKPKLEEKAEEEEVKEEHLNRKGKGEGSHDMDKKGSKKICTPRMTSSNKPSRFKTDMLTPDGKRKKKKPNTIKNTKQLTWRLRRKGRGIRENKLMW